MYCISRWRLEWILQCAGDNVMSYMGQTTLKASDIRRVDVTSSTSATHTLTWEAPNEQSLIVTINGVKQQNNYTVSGTTLTLDTALVATDALEVIGINDIGTTITPAEGSVNTAQLANDAVTADKLAAGLANATHTGDVTGATALTIATDAVDIAMLSATGTADATTFLRGDNAWASTGKILQVVSAGTATYAGSSTAVYVDTGLTVTITPASTSNKILILGTQADCYSSSGNTNNSIHIRLVRDSTEILDVCDRALYTGSALEQMQNVSFNYLDSPSLDVAITYKTQFHNQGAYANVAVQQQNAGRSTITVMEIEA